jgi:hypothetical protein
VGLLAAQGFLRTFFEMKAGSVLLFPLFDRQNTSAESSELGQFLLDLLQPFMPLAVSDLSLCFIAAPIPRTPVLGVQLLKVSDLGTETPDLFPQDG